MKKIALVFLFSILCTPFFGITGTEILDKLDVNNTFRTQAFRGSMSIIRGKRRLDKSFFGYYQEEGDKNYMEYTNKEDRGVKQLKLDDNLWIYFPDADDILKISGHMLQEGMMGSDISYEDMMENKSYRDRYNINDEAQIISYEGKDHYFVTLDAKDSSVTYVKQVMTIDMDTFAIRKVDLYARSGKEPRLIKTMYFDDIRHIGERYIPFHMKVEDIRKKDSYTLIIYEELHTDIKVPTEFFSRSKLGS